MKKYFLIIFIFVLLVGGGIILSRSFSFGEFPKKIAYLTNNQLASLATIVGSPFYYNFKVDGTLTETGKMNDSSSPYWWLNSSGMFYLKDGIGKTIQGELPALNKWRLAYFLSNPVDTDNGYHPQNIFRLVTRSKWQNFRQEIYFNIAKINLSQSDERNAWSGILLFSHYQNGDNLYYAGIRVDGNAIIKKKINGKYYTMAEKVFYSGVYNRDTNPNIIPEKKWIGLRSEIKTNADGTVNIKVFINKDKTGVWALAVEASDDAKTYGGAAFLNDGYAGIRTDFMDVEFDDYGIIRQ